jgi:hypothetical protein
VPGANLAFPVPGDLPRTFGPQGPHGELHGGLKRIAWGWMDIWWYTNRDRYRLNVDIDCRYGYRYRYGSRDIQI